MSARKVPQDEELKRLYVDERLSSGYIAERCGASRATVCRHLRRLEIVRPQSGRNSRNRKFHKQVHRKGYWVTFRPDHPRANHQGYVYDHLLAIEEKVGRTPKKDERVHHIDLDHQNNDPENLYLCASNGEHLQAHWSLNEVAGELIRRGVIGFEDGRYFLREGQL